MKPDHIRIILLSSIFFCFLMASICFHKEYKDVILESDIILLYNGEVKEQWKAIGYVDQRDKITFTEKDTGNRITIPSEGVIINTKRYKQEAKE